MTNDQLNKYLFKNRSEVYRQIKADAEVYAKAELEKLNKESASLANTSCTAFTQTFTSTSGK
jgi:hypothetical protein